MNWNECYAAHVLRRDGVIVHATEGVFGLAGAHYSQAAYRRISTLKGRDPNRSPFLLIAAAIDQIAGIVDLGVPYLSAVEASWPGPVTWIFSIKTEAYRWIAGPDGTLGVRLTAHRQAARLCAEVGPLISTSANRHGQPAALDLAEARAEFGAAVDVYLPGRLQTPGRPSQIRDARSGEWLRR